MLKGGGIFLLDDEDEDEGREVGKNKSRSEWYKNDVEREVERIKIKVGMSFFVLRLKLIVWV